MKTPTMDDVAARAGVSRALVSLVMRGSPKVSAVRREAVLAAVQDLGYRPNAAARLLAERSTATIGVVVSDLHNPFFAEVLDGIHDAAEGARYRLLLNTSWNHRRGERQAVESFLEFRLDGVIVVGGRMDPATFVELGRTAPLASIGKAVSGVDSVVNDDRRGGELVAEHLVELGHRRIVHIDGGGGAGAVARRDGFVGALRRRGIEATVVAGDFDGGPAASAVDVMVAAGELPTAIFAANDLSAVAALSRLGAHGVSVPDEVSVVGYDNTAMSAFGHVALTTVHQPRHEMGMAGFACVLERRRRPGAPPVARVVEPSLISRATTGSPRSR